MRRVLVPFFLFDRMIRVLCPSCRLVFMQLTPADDAGVVCPRCGTRFQPDEEEIVDPEDD